MPVTPLRLHWRVAVGVSSVAELAKTVGAPGPDRAIALEHQTILRTAGDRGDPAQVPHLHRRVALDRGPIAQLAGAVFTPGPDRAVAFECQVMALTGGDGLDFA